MNATFLFVCATSVVVALSVRGVPAAAALPGPVPAIVERVVDGDTIAVRAQIWVDTEVRVSVRVAGVDAPEIFRPRCAAERAAGRAATDFVTGWVAAAENAVQLSGIDLDKYGGRVVASVARAADGADLAEDLRNAGHAIAEETPEPWCAEVDRAAEGVSAATSSRAGSARSARDRSRAARDGSAPASRD